MQNHLSVDNLLLFVASLLFSEAAFLLYALLLLFLMSVAALLFSVAVTLLHY